MMPTLAEIEKEGSVAFAKGVPASACPYSFIASPFWEKKNYEGFNAEWRPQLNAWMKGWIDAQRRAR